MLNNEDSRIKTLEWLAKEYSKNEILACLSIIETALPVDDWYEESPISQSVGDYEILCAASNSTHLGVIVERGSEE
ncbi:MAG: hypothetical protein ACFFFC_15640 [Candidatus Thorarchaeota archaeon]